jgi:hypothetical protein
METPNPKEFVKSAQALDIPIHQGKMDAEYITAMWSDAGVGVTAQKNMMKYFIRFLGHKFTAAEVLITQLAVDLVPPVVGTVQCMDPTLDYWYKVLDKHENSSKDNLNREPGCMSTIEY